MGFPSETFQTSSSCSFFFRLYVCACVCASSETAAGWRYWREQQSTVTHQLALIASHFYPAQRPTANYSGNSLQCKLSLLSPEEISAPTETSSLTHTHTPFTSWLAPTQHTETHHLHSSERNHNRCCYITQEDPHYLVKVLAGCNNSTRALSTVFVFRMWASVCMSITYSYTHRHRKPKQRWQEVNSSQCPKIFK